MANKKEVLRELQILAEMLVDTRSDPTPINIKNDWGFETIDSRLMGLLVSHLDKIFGENRETRIRFLRRAMARTPHCRNKIITSTKDLTRGAGLTLVKWLLDETGQPRRVAVEACLELANYFVAMPQVVGSLGDRDCDPNDIVVQQELLQL